MDAASGLTGISNQRPMPTLATGKIKSGKLISGDKVIFLTDSFAHYFEPTDAALAVLAALD
jgi:hypothetical protein